MSDQATPVITPETVAPATNKRWYVVHAYSGMEKAVERNLRERIDRAGMQEKFGRILVPMEEVVELKNGKKSNKKNGNTSHQPGADGEGNSVG